MSRIEELPPLPDQEGQLDFDELEEMAKERELEYPDTSQESLYDTDDGAEDTDESEQE